MRRSSYLSTSLSFFGVLLLLTHCATNLDGMREAAQGHAATVQTLLTQGANGNTVLCWPKVRMSTSKITLGRPL